MKPVIIIALAFVLLIPINVFAYEHYPQPILNDFVSAPEPSIFEFKGDAHRSLGNYYMAFLNYDKALETEPDNLVLKQAKDNSYNAWKNYQNFINEKESDIIKYNLGFSTYQELINTSFSNSDYYGTIKYSNELEKILPETSVAYNNKYRALLFLGEYNEAQKAFEKYAETYPLPKNSLGYVDIQMTLFYSMGKYQESIDLFQIWNREIGFESSIENNLIPPSTRFIAAMSYEKLGDKSNSEFWYDLVNDEFNDIECIKIHHVYPLGLFNEIVEIMESNNTFEKCSKDTKYRYVVVKDIISGEYLSPITRTSSENTPDYSTLSETSEPICGKGTIEKNGQCIVDSNYKLNGKSSKGGGCLIATATFGSELAPQVQQLRELRDNYLLQTESGSSFINSFNDFYYSFSPIIADYERENPVFREMVKVVITPMISSLSLLNYVDMDSEVEVLGYGISLILLNIGMYFTVPAIVIMRFCSSEIRKK